MVLSSARAETLLEIDNPAYAARIEADRKTTSVFLWGAQAPG